MQNMVTLGAYRVQPGMGFRHIVVPEPLSEDEVLAGVLRGDDHFSICWTPPGQPRCTCGEYTLVEVQDIGV